MPVQTSRPQTALRLATAAASLCAVTACRPGMSPALAGPVSADSSRLRADIAWLADDARDGRGTGTAGLDSASAWIAGRLAALGLAPAGGPCGEADGCLRGFAQPFVARSIARQRAGRPWELPARNLAGIVRGTDPVLRDEYVIVGAHYDHLGRDTTGALDPDAGPVIRNGADDNASGTAAVLELARLTARRPARRSVVFVLFSGEELGLLGSAWYADHPPQPLAATVAMLNFDMVGRLERDQLQVFGTATADEWPALLERLNATAGFRLTASGDGFGRSDHSSFYAKGLPVLHFFSGTHADYHRASDDAERANPAGEARIVDYAAAVLRAVADGPRLTFRKAPEPVAQAPRAGRGAYLGTIPDMAAGDGTGLRLTGVRAGSPAEGGGLRADDVIVEFAGQAVRDLYGYTDAIASHAPGDTVTIVVRRGGQRVPLRVVLGRRGG